MLAKCLENAWKMLGKSLENAWKMLGKCLENACENSRENACEYPCKNTCKNALKMLLKWYKESYKKASKMLVRMTFTCITFHVCLYQNFRAKFNVCKWDHLFYSTLNDAFYWIEIKKFVRNKGTTSFLLE
jgi:hypothetical protein